MKIILNHDKILIWSTLKSMSKDKINKYDQQNIPLLDGEIWKPVYIAPYNKRYSVSNKGRVKNHVTDNVIATFSKQNRGGYCSAHLSYNKEEITIKNHVLVAKTFIPNPEDKPYVNHLDNDKLNNCVENLQWNTGTEHVQHSVDTGVTKALQRKVKQYDAKTGEFIKEYDSALEAAQAVGLIGAKPSGPIIKCCKGKQKTSKGFIWKYSEINENEDVKIEDLREPKPFPEFPNYLVDKNGKVYSIGGRKGSNPRCMKFQENADGYLHVQLTDKGRKKDFLVHRLVAITHIPNPENKATVNHINGKQKQNNCIENLEWMTVSENVQHSHDTGLR